MPQINRLVVSRGPALITFAGGKFFSKGDISVDLTKKTKAIPSSAYGDLDEVVEGVENTLKFTPVGEFEHLAVLFPYAGTLPGQSIFGSADAPLLVQPLDTTQPQITFHAAAISKMPDLNFAATETLFGDVEFSFVGKNNTDTNDANYYFTSATNALTGASPYDPDALIIQAYKLTWLSAGTFTLTYGANTTGALAYNITAASLATALNALASITSAGGVTVTGDYQAGYKVTFNSNGVRTNISGTTTGMTGGTTVVQTISTPGAAGAAQIVTLALTPWAAFNSREGVKVAFSLKTTDDTADAIGVYDKIFGSLGVTATLIPSGVTEAALLSAAATQGAESVRGRKLSKSGADLNIYGDGVYFRMYAAGIRKSGLLYGSDNQRLAQVEFVASRSVAAGGTLNPLFYIGATAPV